MSLKDAEAGKHDFSVDVKEASIHHHTGLEGTLRDESDATGVVRALKARHIQLIGELATTSDHDVASTATATCTDRCSG